MCGISCSLSLVQNRGTRYDASAHSCHGREAAFIKCDVTKWDEQVALFELAIERFGSVDIVVSVALMVPPFRVSSVLQLRPYSHFAQVPNAGIEESERVCLGNMKLVDGKPSEPKLLTLKVNLTGVIYSEKSPLVNDNGPSP